MPCRDCARTARLLLAVRQALAGQVLMVDALLEESVEDDVPACPNAECPTRTEGAAVDWADDGEGGRVCGHCDTNVGPKGEMA